MEKLGQFNYSHLMGEKNSLQYVVPLKKSQVWQNLPMPQKKLKDVELRWEKKLSLINYNKDQWCALVHFSRIYLKTERQRFFSFSFKIWI